MTDSRVTKLAQVLVRYSLNLQPGETFLLRSGPAAQELTLAVYQEAILAGAHVLLISNVPGTTELFFKHANDEQLEYVSPVQRMIAEQFDATLSVGAAENTRALAGVDPQRLSRAAAANREIQQIFLSRAAKNELKWCYTVYPTNAYAQEADMSLSDYEEFVFGAGMLDKADPVAAWQAEGERQRQLIKWLHGRDQVVIKGANIDLTLSIKERRFKEADGRYNFPDGEIFTGPVEHSVNGWVRFGYPAIFAGQEVTDIELWFEEGKVVKERAAKNEALLTATLNTDEGARYLGEWGIGTNYNIRRFTKNMLFDEKIGGTIHFAVGSSYPETGGQNESAIHWDMLCDMAESEISVDGELFYKDGKPVVLE